MKAHLHFGGLLMAAALAGCTGVHVGGTVHYPLPAPPVHAPAPNSNIHIPPGHYPPPGACRIWYPGRAPGQQPPPGDCLALQHQVPPGAVLVRGR